MDTEIRVSTESRPWRRKFSRRSSRDSNPRPFNHESGALTTELSPPPYMARGRKLPFIAVRERSVSSLSCFLSKVVSLAPKSTLVVPLTVSFFVFQRRVVADSAAPIVLVDPSSAP